MVRFLLRRAVGLVVVLVAISAVTFALFFLLPGDPARLSCGRAPSDSCVAAARHGMGLDQPVYAQYGTYVRGIVAGRWYPDAAAPQRVRCPAPCLGYSFIDDQPVATTIASRLPATASLAVGAAVIWLVLGCGAGVLASMRRGSVFDRATSVFALVGVSLPSFLTGLVALYLFAGLLHWLPFGGYQALVTGAPGADTHWYWLFTHPGTTLSHLPGWAEHLLLPWLTLALVFAAFYSRLTRALMRDVLTEDFIRTARAKGLPRRRIVLGHGLRAALAPIVTAAGIDFGVLLGGTALTEQVYGINGVGSMLVGAVGNTDLPQIVGIVLVASVFVLVATVVVDLLALLVDPTVRTGSRS